MPNKIWILKTFAILLFSAFSIIFLPEASAAVCETCEAPFDTATSDGMCAYNPNGCPSSYCANPSTECAAISSVYTGGEWRWDDGTMRSVLYCNNRLSGAVDRTGSTCNAGCSSCPADTGGGSTPGTQHDPTGYFSNYPGDPSIGYFSKLKVGSSYTFNAKGHDDDSNLDRIGIWRARYGTRAWVVVGGGEDDSCSGRDCTSVNRNWSPVESDIFAPNSANNYYRFAVNVYDTSSRRCTGDPIISTGWADCDNNSSDLTSDYYEACLYMCPKSENGSYDQITLLSPANGAVINNASQVTLSWDKIEYGASCNTFSGYSPSQYIYFRQRGTVTWYGRSVPLANSSYNLTGLMPNTEYEWRLNPTNGEFDCSNQSAIWTFRTSFDQPATGRFTALGGSIYSPRIVLRGPTDTTASNEFIPAYLADRNGTIDSGGSVMQANSTNINLTNIGIKVPGSTGRVGYNDLMVWPANSTALDKLNGTPSPMGSDAIRITISNYATLRANLDPTKVYYAQNHVALNNFLNGTTTNCPSSTCSYTLTRPGVAVVYYLGDNSQTITLNKNFRSSAAGSDRRVLLVTNSPVVIGNGVQSSNPQKTTRANLELGIVSTNSITFQGSTPVGSDQPVVVEGPVISENVVFNRVTQYNVYPAEIVRFNPVYLTELNKISEDYSNLFKGIFTSEIYWEESN